MVAPELKAEGSCCSNCCYCCQADTVGIFRQKSRRFFPQLPLSLSFSNYLCKCAVVLLPTIRTIEKKNEGEREVSNLLAIKVPAALPLRCCGMLCKHTCTQMPMHKITAASGQSWRSFRRRRRLSSLWWWVALSPVSISPTWAASTCSSLNFDQAI